MRILIAFFLIFCFPFSTLASAVVVRCDSKVGSVLQASSKIYTQNLTDDHVFKKQVETLRHQYERQNLLTSSLSVLGLIEKFEKIFEDLSSYGEDHLFFEGMRDLLKEHKSLDYELDSLVVASSFFKSSAKTNFNNTFFIRKHYKNKIKMTLKRLLLEKSKADYLKMSDADFFGRLSRVFMIFSGPNGTFRDDFLTQNEKQDLGILIHHFMNSIIKKAKTDSKVLNSLENHVDDYKDFLEKFSTTPLDVIDRDYALDLISEFDREYVLGIPSTQR